MAQRKILTLKTKSKREPIEPIQEPTGNKCQTPPTNKEEPEDTIAPQAPAVPKEGPPANTATQTKAQRKQNWATRRAAAKAYKQYLIEHYPTLFGEEPKPLKIGIHKDLNQTRGPHSKKTMHFFMSGHTQSKAYLQALIKGGPRYDLNDQPAGTVTELQQQSAQQALDKLENRSRSAKT